MISFDTVLLSNRILRLLYFISHHILLFWILILDEDLSVNDNWLLYCMRMKQYFIFFSYNFDILVNILFFYCFRLHDSTLRFICSFTFSVMQAYSQPEILEFVYFIFVFGAPDFNFLGKFILFYFFISPFIRFFVFFKIV